MNRKNIFALLNEYHIRYDELLASSDSSLYLYSTEFGRILNWMRQEHPDDYAKFRSRLLTEIDDPSLQKEILDAAYTAMLINFVPDLNLLTPQTLETLFDSDKMGTGDVLIDLLLRRDYGTRYKSENKIKLHGPQSMSPFIVEEIVSRIPRMYELVLELKPLQSHIPIYEPEPKQPSPKKAHPIKPQLPIPISNYGSLWGSEFNQYIFCILDLLQNKDVMAAVCKRLIENELYEENPPAIWSQIITDFYGADTDDPIVKFYTEQTVAEHIYMRQAEMMQPSKEDDALTNNAEIVQRKIRSSLNLARFIYLNYSQATDHLNVVATALTSTMTRGLIYYIGDQKIQDMDLEQVQELIKEKLKLPREKDAEFALFLKSFKVKPPVLRLTSG